MNEEKGIKLNLGCGDQRLSGFIGLDRLHRRGTDLICDLGEGLPLADGSVSHIYAKSVLEHIFELESLLAEMVRVLETNGTLYIYVPHWSNPFYYSDYTHQRFFGLASFDYFAAPSEQCFRRVPTYSGVKLKTVDVRLLFKSPFRLMHWFLKAWQWMVNRSRRGQLFYEFHLSSLFPCYAIEFRLQKIE